MRGNLSQLLPVSLLPVLLLLFGAAPGCGGCQELRSGRSAACRVCVDREGEWRLRMSGTPGVALLARAQREGTVVISVRGTNGELLASLQARCEQGHEVLFTWTLHRMFPHFYGLGVHQTESGQPIVPRDGAAPSFMLFIAAPMAAYGKLLAILGDRQHDTLRVYRAPSSSSSWDALTGGRALIAVGGSPIDSHSSGERATLCKSSILLVLPDDCIALPEGEVHVASATWGQLKEECESGPTWTLCVAFEGAE